MYSDEVKALIDYAPAWAEYSVMPQFCAENLDSAYVYNYWWWGYKAVTDNSLLTLDGDPWMLGAASDQQSWLPAAFDFDIYPRPATAYNDSTCWCCIRSNGCT